MSPSLECVIFVHVAFNLCAEFIYERRLLITSAFNEQQLRVVTSLIASSLSLIILCLLAAFPSLIFLVFLSSLGASFNEVYI